MLHVLAFLLIEKVISTYYVIFSSVSSIFLVIVAAMYSAAALFPNKTEKIPFLDISN
jgi:hypothetical protein